MNVFGHDKQVAKLKKVAQSEKVPHALLFAGPDAIGKRKTAKEFIKHLNCENNEACGECRFCREFERQQLDFTEIKSEDEITIDEIRDLQDSLALTSTGKEAYKTAVIDNAHLLNRQAQSCLLKTLEEPPGKSVIILVTDRPNFLFDTILSRVWQINFTPVHSKLIKEKLISRGADPEEAETITEVSFFRPGLAIKLFENPEFKEDWLQKREDIAELREASYPDRFEYVKKMSKDRSEAEETLRIWIAFLREKMIEKLKTDQSIEEIEKSLRAAQKSLKALSRTNVNLKLSLEKLIINL